MKEHSRYPFRSERLKLPESYNFTNNRIDVSLPRGTYRLQAVSVFTDAAWVVHGFVLFCVGKRTAIENFPIGTTFLNANGEVLGVTSCRFVAAGTIGEVSHGDPVEIDILDNEILTFWSYAGTEAIKITMVGELPTEDPELEGRRRE